MGLFDEVIEDAELRTKVEEIHTNDVTATLDAETTGLKNKNTELLDEAKKAKKTLGKITDQIGDLDIEELKSAHALVNSEEGKLLKDGKKLEELVDVKISGLKSDYETRLEEATSKALEAEASSSVWETKFRNKTVEDALRDAAIAAKVRPEALQDVISRGRGVFAMSDEGDTVEARDAEGSLLKIGESIATPKVWVESLKESAPHYWPGSQGADLTGKGAGSGSDNHSKMMDAAKRQDIPAYRKYKALYEKEQAGA